MNEGNLLLNSSAVSCLLGFPPLNRGKFIQELPESVDTVVGAVFGGVTDLSGRQWQRLALARLLYHDAPIIIPDEPSSSLDPVGERQIFSLLANLAEKKIILFTTHRYDMIRKADKIMVLVEGKIAEVGTHEELDQKARPFGRYIWGRVLSENES